MQCLVHGFDAAVDAGDVERRHERVGLRAQRAIATSSCSKGSSSLPYTLPFNLPKPTSAFVTPCHQWYELKPVMGSSATTETDFSVLPELEGDIYTAPLQKPAHLGDDWVEPQQADYDQSGHAIWDELFERQMGVLPGRAATAFMRGLEKLDLARGGVPEFDRLSAELDVLTGWSVIPVPMLIPDHVFFWHLANRRFPAGNFIRTRETFDYIQEPDVFHDADDLDRCRATTGQGRVGRGGVRRARGRGRGGVDHPSRHLRAVRARRRADG